MAEPVVIDLGSGSCKAGLAAAAAPRLVPSRVGRPKYGHGAMIGAAWMVPRDVLVQKRLMNSMIYYKP